MARTNTLIRTAQPQTHEGAPAKRISAEQALRRSVLSCLLWEREFYEEGEDIATRIHELAAAVPVATLAQIAIEARQVYNLRHVPLWLLVALIKHGRGSRIVSDTIAQVVSRADEPGELLSLYWKVNGANAPLAAQLKRGLAAVMPSFDPYELAKYNRDTAVRARDVLFLTHAKPLVEGPTLHTDAEAIERNGYKRGRVLRHAAGQGETWSKLIEGKLEAPDTWEVALSGGADKRETFERLLREKTLGYLALLRNLRNMANAGVDTDLIVEAILARRGARRVLPFRYVAALRAAPQFAHALDRAMTAHIEEESHIPGQTIILVDVSGSMSDRLSAKSDMKRMDAAAGLAALWPGTARIFSFSVEMVEVPAFKGMACIDAIIRSQPHSYTYLGKAVQTINEKFNADRLIVITDEQSHDRVPEPLAKNAYMINVASAKNGVGYGSGWTHIDGFSEAVIRYIRESEREAALSDERL